MSLWDGMEEREGELNIKAEIRTDDVIVAKLAVAYTLLALAPYDNWSHEGSPAEMAAYVVESARKQGNLGFLRDILFDHV